MKKALDIKNIKLMAYDFDGVMTNNTVLVGQDGKEFVRVNRGDGLAIDVFRKLHIPQIILSTESSKVVEVRAKKLKLPVIHDCKDKKKALSEYCKANKIDLNNVLYVGNDINDFEVMRVVGFRICPKDAHYKIKQISDVKTKAKGGEGVIRELIDILKIS